jgi:hypothetical protein
MKLLIIFGPPAVGKMTVGKEVSKKTNLKLFHNHMTIEPLLKIFEYKSAEFQRLNSLFRKSVFEEFAQSSNEGMIFTFVWALDKPSELSYLEKLSKPFKDRDADIFYIELSASQKVRRERNKGADRLYEKASKRDVQASEERLIDNDTKHVLNSSKEFPCPVQKNYLKINSESLSAEDVALRVINFINMQEAL